MELIFIIMLFCMGTVFGSFFTLAVYRIPLGLDITHERSFCPKCNHRLEFIDLIPILSYLSVKGKCRYCNEPIRIRYLLLEFASGIIFVIGYFAFHFNFPFLETENVVSFVGFVFFYITNCIILGIDKEYITINKKVLLFGIITNTLYMLYLCIFEEINIYRYGIYLVILLILFCLNKKNNYFLGVLSLIFYEFFGTGAKNFFSIDNFLFLELSHLIILGILIILSMCITNLIFKKIKKQDKIPFGFGVSVISIIYSLLINLV